MSAFTQDSATFFRLDGKVALITGGSRGIGYYTAEAFLRAGAAQVILASRKAEGSAGLNQALQKLDSLRREGSFHGHATGLVADVSKTADIERLMTDLKRITDKLDILVANAGATWGGSFEETPDASNVKVLDTNVRGTFNLVRLSLPFLTKAASPKDPSRVIVVGSTAGLGVPLTGRDGTIMYSVSKAAVHHLVRNLAVELAPEHITTNAVVPGFFPTKLSSGIINTLGHEQLADTNPLGRLGEPEDIAGTMVYLASTAGRYVNGVNVVLDGGAHLVSSRPSRL